jgi:hypothetical protein
MLDLIKYSIDKFKLNLKDYTVLTEAASGNYACTPLLAANAGASVYAYGKDSKYGKFTDVKRNLEKLAKKLKINNIIYINNLNEIDLSKIDILTNTGFLRPINQEIIDKLNKECVIPLMYEPWEFRKTDIDIDSCEEKGIKVYGTNETDTRLLTMNYIGYIVLHFLLKEKKTPFTANILLLGSAKFNDAIKNILSQLNFRVTNYITKEFDKTIDINGYNIIVCTEFVSDDLLIGNKNSLINKAAINEKQLIIHIAGNVDIKGIKAKIYPKNPAPSNYMSYTTDFIDPLAVVDLHCAGLKVAEGMQIANKKKLNKIEYKAFMENNYPALDFENNKYFNNVKN